MRNKIRPIWRRLSLGLATLSGLAPRGFFIPYRYAGRMPAPDTRPRSAALVSTLDASRDSFAETLAAIERYAAPLAAIGADGPPPGPRWAQGWFPRLDGAAAYAMVRERRPRRIVEVGSGHSTRFLARAICDAGLATTIVAIDPAPRADIAALPVTLYRATLQEVGLAPFAGLASGDLVMIDSSHILMPGSDVDFWLNHLWPCLAPGVLVQVHDIFLPDDYPEPWGWRGYNEQLGVAPLILSGAAELLFASHYVATRMADALAATVVARLPLPAEAPESSLWLVKRAAAVL